MENDKQAGIQIARGFFLYSAALLPTFNSFPFYDIGWTLQHEIVFYLVAAAIVPWLGLRGLALVLFVSAVAVRKVDMPWYLAMYAEHHGEFSFIARGKMARYAFVPPFVIGAALLGYFASNEGGKWFPIALFFLIVAFANLNPSEGSWWQRPPTTIGDASYSMYLIHPVVFLTTSSVISKFPNAPLWSEEPIRLGCIILIVAISLLSWRYFERPFIRLGNKIASLKPTNVIVLPT